MDFWQSIPLWVRIPVVWSAMITLGVIVLRGISGDEQEDGTEE